MIRCFLRDGEGRCQSGGEEILRNWDAAGEQRLWLDIEGHPENARQLLQSLGCDKLSIRDSFRARHPPKVEEFSANTFILFRGIVRMEESMEMEPQQIGLWVGRNTVISVHREPSVSVNHFWNAVQQSGFNQSPAELALKLLHFASGRYLDALLAFEERLGELEDSLLAGQSESDMKALVTYRSNLRRLRRTLGYHNDLASEIYKTGSVHLGAAENGTSHIRRNLLDRCERNYSLCSMYYELCSDLIEGHISFSSHNLNQTMKILTIISALFVPLTFLAGIYGMNFEHMPELSHPNAYFILLGVMAVTAVVMLVIFRRIKWL